MPESSPEERPLVPTAEPVVRVRVRRIDDAKDMTLSIDAEGGWLEFVRRPGDEAEPSIVLHAPLRIEVRRRAWSILDAKRFRPLVEGFEPLELRPLGGGIDAPISVDGIAYPGFIRLVPFGETTPPRIDVVNHVAIEQYLPGVLARELYSHWDAEAFAAQAVAARSFACAEHSYRSRRRYDVTSTTRSQVYGGANAHPRAAEAVAATRGVMLLYENRLVSGYYSACCGGLAATARDVIGDHPYNAIAPLEGHAGSDACTDAPLYTWTIERERDEARARLRAYGAAKREERLAALDSIEGIEVAATNAHGRPRTYAVHLGGDAPVELSAESLRRALDHAVKGRAGPTKRLWSSYLAVDLDDRQARFLGRGHGHGAGLCQHGAQALALEGTSHRDILAWYYPGAALTRAYP